MFITMQCIKCQDENTYLLCMLDTVPHISNPQNTLK